MEYSTSTQMANQMETGIEKMVKKEELNDRYSTFANAGDRKKRSEKVKRSIDSMFRRSVKVEISTAEVENTGYQHPAKNANQITVRRAATIEPIPIKVRNNSSTDRHEPGRTTPTFADTGRNECSIWESEPEDQDDVCSDDDGYMNEIGSSNKRHVEANSNNANGCDGSQFTCLDCAAVFETNTAFKVHIASHAGYRRFKCTVCEKRFSHNGHFKVHLRFHTGERPFGCDVCGKKFTTNGELIVHKRIHTGERPFDCDVCEKKFTTSGNLAVHKRTHTGERPHKCDICNKGFAQSGDLVRHKQTHTGEKPYKCLTCGKCFARTDNLQTYKRTHADSYADPQLDAPQDGRNQSSTIDACDPHNNSFNGQKIRHKSRSIDYVVEKMASKNPDVVYVVWSRLFTIELASAVARSGSNCILCVKKIQPQPFRDVVNLSNGLHICAVEVESGSKTLRLFSFGGIILPENITNHGKFKSLAKLESKMRRFSRSEGMTMVNIFKHSERNSGWYRSLRDGLQGDCIITDYV